MKEMTFKNIFVFALLIFTTNIGLVLSQENECKSIDHCLKCPQSDKCEECEQGFALNTDGNKCETKDNTGSNAAKSSKLSSQKSKVSSQKSQASSHKSQASSQKEENKSNASASSSKKTSQKEENKSNASTSSSKKSSQANSSSSKKSSTNANASTSSQKNQNTPSASSTKKSSENNNNNLPNASNEPEASNKSLLTAFHITKRLGPDSTRIGLKILLFVVISVCIILCLRCLFKKKPTKKAGYYYDESGLQDENAKVVYIR